MKDILKHQIKRQVKPSSLSADSEYFNKYILSHWVIENNLHWQLDMEFKEEESQKRKNNSAINFSLICIIALNLLSRHKEPRVSYKRLKHKALTKAFD